MEFVKSLKLNIFLTVVAILAICIFAFTGCGGSDNFTLTNDADVLFVIRDGYVSSEGEYPLLEVLGLNTADGMYVSYEVEDSSIFDVRADGTIAVAETSEQKVTYVTATFNNNQTKIKVVVAGDYNPLVYKNYDNLYIPYGTEVLGTDYAESSIKYLNLPSTVKEYADSAFYGCKDLTEVVLPTNMTVTPKGIFDSCSSLTKVELPSSITEIGESSFRDCDSLEEINLHEGITLLNDFSFYSCGAIKEIKLPESLKYIGQRSFCNCTSLESISIPSNVTKINNDTFSYCSALSLVELPDTLTSIGDRAFLSCTGLVDVVIPKSVNSIGLDAYSGCINIKSLTMPLSLPLDKSVFPSVAGIEYFKLTGNGDGYDYNSSNYVNAPWYISRNHKIKVDVEEGVTAIGDYTFVYCKGLVEINLPNSLNKICHGAFRKCFNLASVHIPDNVTSIELYAFSLDYALSDLVLPKNLYRIEEYAFYSCTSLKDIEIPNATTFIGDYAFAGCNNIETIKIGTSSKSNLKSIGQRAFAGFLFNCHEVNIYSTKLKYVANGAFGYIGDEEPAYTVGTLSKDSVITVPSSKKKLFIADDNYNSKDTTIKTR